MYAENWHLYTDHDHDMLTQEISMFLKNFEPPPRERPGRYRQVDITEAIEAILKKKDP